MDERFDDDYPHDDPGELFGEDENEVDYLVGSCQCRWSGSGMFYRGDKADLNKATQKLHKEHV